MFGFRSAAAVDHDAVLQALGRALAIIEFDPNGKILNANENFCQALGYDLSEIRGQHHSMFVDPSYASSADYRDFWQKLARGEFDTREYKRIAKGGREVWIQASYNPVVDARGAVTKVVKVATDITAAKIKNAEFESKLEAISRVQAVIEFTLKGEVLTANNNFLSVLGYSLDEIRGRHHRMFVEPAYGQSSDYQEFWRKLNAGEAISASFKRIGKGGKEVWIQASYNPIYDMNGKMTKVVKFANDITDLTEIGAGLSRLAGNDLDHRIEKSFAPTFEKLRLDFNVAHDNLKSALLEVADSAGLIEAGTHQISASADELSERTAGQAASLEETAAALDEITATVRKSAEGASHARRVVATADEDAKKSAVVVREAVEAMDAIAKSAQQIGQIIGVIDEIAFQTNLLALNAGVEAARAGDAGRGFAVVASEVRALAQRSAEAAKEIKSLISASSTQVARGVSLVGETGKSLERILVQVADINSVMGDIAAGAKEQSTALEEVNSAINQMDQVTQKNTAMVEETTAAGRSLSQEAGRLSVLIGRFQLGSSAAFDQVRGALKKVAPHAFAAPEKSPVTGSGGGGAAPTATHSAGSRQAGRRGAAPSRAASGAAARQSEQWQEF